jgi:hypothetical protein
MRRSALAAEALLPCKPLTPYQERCIEPRRATNAARAALVWLGRWFVWRAALATVRPTTPVRRHRQALRPLWRWKSRPGRPPVPLRGQVLIRRMTCESPAGEQEHTANGLWLQARPTIRAVLEVDVYET